MSRLTIIINRQQQKAKLFTFNHFTSVKSNYSNSTFVSVSEYQVDCAGKKRVSLCQRKDKQYDFYDMMAMFSLNTRMCKMREYVQQICR